MAYFNGFPATYTPYYTPIAPVQQPAQPVQPSVQGGVIWVSGEAGAKSYLVAPNTTVQLWDSESQTIYLKSADGSGMPSMKILDYTVRDSVKNGLNSPLTADRDNLSGYATKTEIQAISAEITALQKRIERMEKTDE